MKICTLCKSRYDDRVDFCFRDGTPLVADTDPLPHGSEPVLGQDLRKPSAPAVQAVPSIPDLASARTEPGHADVVEPRFSFRRARSTGGAAGRLAMGGFDTPASALLDVPEKARVAPPLVEEVRPRLDAPEAAPPTPITPTTLVPEELDEAETAPAPSWHTAATLPEASEPPPWTAGPQEAYPAPFEEEQEVPVPELPEEATEPITQPVTTPMPRSRSRVLPWMAGIVAVLVMAVAALVMFGRGGEAPIGMAGLSPSQAPAPEAEIAQIEAAPPEAEIAPPEAEIAQPEAAPPEVEVAQPEVAQPEAEVAQPEVTPAPFEFTEIPPVPATPPPAAIPVFAEPSKPEVQPTRPPEAKASTAAGTAAPDVPIPGGALTVRSDPGGAVVRIGDKVLGRTPIEGYTLAPGRHTVRVEKDGYSTVSRLVDVRSGEVADLGTVPLESAVRVTGKVTLWGDGLDGARVYVDNQFVGILPFQTTLAEGSYAFFVQPPSGDSFSVVRNVKFEVSGIGISLELQRP